MLIINFQYTMTSLSTVDDVTRFDGNPDVDSLKEGKLEVNSFEFSPSAFEAHSPINYCQINTSK
jgi:hypothetical protein